MSYCDSSDDSVKNQVRDDFGRHFLTDSSAVLTEDTDSFIIGQRVWVSGTKPGHIAFIGETQFAPGEWAGIALDEAIGKNDGSVGGIHYFQCEPKKGVFSRLTRLTRVPLAQEGMGSGETYVSSSPVHNTVRRSPVSPAGSARSLLRSPVSISGSNTSLASTTPRVIDYKVGDRVIIKSSQGSKVGTVKYMGTTEFASGDWVGVELDDPRGKNDGSVNGKRYFECRPNFGLFAPTTKVSKSPSKIKPGSCQIHSGPGLPPSGLRRTNSKESMLSNMSVTSSVASTARRVRLGITSLTPKKTPPKTTTAPLPTRTALQDVLKEKQQHIEQLLKERDLERVEITRASSQVDEAEQKLTNLRQEYDKYQAQCTATNQEHLMLLNKLEGDRNTLLAQIEDEKRKNEDLQFRLEELSISKDDIIVLNETNVNEIKQLKEQLIQEREKVERSESDANKLFEAEESLIKAKEDIEILRTQLQEARDKEASLRDENVFAIARVDSFQEVADRYKKDQEEKDSIINTQKMEISRITADMTTRLNESEKKITEMETLYSTEKQISEKNFSKEIERLKMDFSAKVLELETLSEDNGVKEQFIVKLKTELDAAQKDLQNFKNSIDENKTNFLSVEINLKAEVERYKTELTEKNTENELLKKKISDAILEHNNITEELNRIVNTNLDTINQLNQEIKIAKESSDGTNAELQDKLKILIEEKDILHQQLLSKLEEKDRENERTQNLYNKLKNDYELKCKELEQKQLEFVACTNDLQNNLRDKSKELDESTISIKAKEDQIKALNTELQTTRVDLESVTSNLSSYQTNLSDIESSLKKERDEIKDILKDKIVELEEAKKMFSEKKLGYEKQVEDLNACITKKSKEVDTLLNGLTTLKQENKDLCKNIVENHAKEILQYENKLLVLSTENQQNTDNIKNLSTISNQLEVSLSEKIKEIESLCSRVENLNGKCQSESDKVNILNAEIISFKNNINELEIKNSELQKNYLDLEAKNEVQKNIIANQNNELEKSSIDVKTYQSKLNETESDLSKERNEIRSMFETKSKEWECIKQDLLKTNSELNNKLLESIEANTCKTKELDTLKAEIVALEEVNKTNSKVIDDKRKREVEEFEIKISDFLTEIENKNTEIEKLTTAVAKSETMYTKNLVELENLQEELKTLRHAGESENSKLIHKIKDLETNNSDYNKQVEDLKAQLNNVSSEKEKIEIEFKSLSKAANTKNTELAEKDKRLEEMKSILEKTELDARNNLHELNINMEKLKEHNKALKESLEKQNIEYEDQKSSHNIEMKSVFATSNQRSELINELQARLSSFEVSISEKDKKIEDQNIQIKNLNDKLIKVSSIQKEVDDTLQNPDPNSLLEEKRFADSQVAFLNSIIVDMQKKNEEQKARIEILEMGYSSAATDELESLGFNAEFRKSAPIRQYCDICEEFDLHETEDCPTQADDAIPISSSQLGKEPKAKPPPRPYCTICEQFGHSTEDCPEDQEF